MLINFIGCPCSGKTTTAAGIFSALKDEGTPAEFVSEQARLYIAARRREMALGPYEQLDLDDYDQIRIMHRQYEVENVLTWACGPDVVIVSDSSPLSALLYMSEEGWSAVKSNGVFDDARKQVELVFYSHPVQRIAILDPNRVHSLEQSLALNERIPAFLEALGIPAIPLFGNAQERLALAMREICSRRG